MRDFSVTSRIWLATPFPADGRDPRVNDLHADLALADTWVAEEATPVINGRGRQKPGIDVSGGLGQLELRLQAVRPAVTDGDRELLDSYLAYLGILVQVHRSLEDMDESS
jgi:hypothetical protein